MNEVIKDMEWAKSPSDGLGASIEKMAVRLCFQTEENVVIPMWVCWDALMTEYEAMGNDEGVKALEEYADKIKKKFAGYGIRHEWNEGRRKWKEKENRRE